MNRYAHAEHFKIIELAFDAIRNLARELMLLRGREMVTCTSLSDDPVHDFAHKTIGSLPSLAVFLVRRHKFAPWCNVALEKSILAAACWALLLKIASSKLYFSFAFRLKLIVVHEHRTASGFPRGVAYNHALLRTRHNESIPAIP